MAPSRCRRTPVPLLNDDAVEEILLRLPPDDPACLFRATTVCRSWRWTLTDAAFGARYRAFHRTPPLLGFLSYGEVYTTLGLFVRTTSLRPSAAAIDFRLDKWYVHDSRDGLVLLLNGYNRSPASRRLVVWDPITGHQTELPKLPSVVACTFRSAAVRRDRPGGSFLVFSQGIKRTSSYACLYSSETGTWCEVFSNEFDSDYSYRIDGKHRSCFVGDTIYIIAEFGNIALRYDLSTQGVSVIKVPLAGLRKVLLMPAEDGARLVFAVLCYNSIYLWSREMTGLCGGDGVVVDADDGWGKHRVIDLHTLIPACGLFGRPNFVGFAEGTNAFFVQTTHGIFSIDVKSLRTWKHSVKRGEDPMFLSFPYMRFYTPDLAY